MMNFRTPVERPERKVDMLHSDRLLVLGSCFAENIGNLLKENKFRCDVNPFGVLYNPLSIAKALLQILEGKVYETDDLFESKGMWHSWMHHSSFSSDISADDCLSRINDRLKSASEELPQIDWLVMTWGTSYVYKYEDEVVGNCHKQPETFFKRQHVPVEMIVCEWTNILRRLKERNPNLKVLFTVSPIRHAKDGMHGNQLSKATLLLAIDELCRKNDNCYYFPSYEILLDELRDYRFYADDMIHPSTLAINYIWECFVETYFGKETKRILGEWHEIKNALRHRPFKPSSETYQKFLCQIMLRINRMKENLPYLDIQNEIELCQSLLKK